MLEFALGCLYMSVGFGRFLYVSTKKKKNFQEFYDIVNTRKVEGVTDLNEAEVPVAVAIVGATVLLFWPLAFLKNLFKSKSE